MATNNNVTGSYCLSE